MRGGGDHLFEGRVAGGREEEDAVKRCSRCGESKPVEEFQVRKTRGARQSWCRPCKNAYDRDWYQRNKDKHKREVAKRRRQEILRLRALVQELKRQPCTDCGERFPPYVMDFDHLRGTKVRSIGRLVTYGHEAGLRAELAKCELVCANCHRIRTHRRGYRNARPESLPDGGMLDDPDDEVADGQGRLVFETRPLYLLN